MSQSLLESSRAAVRPLCEPLDIFAAIRIDAEVRRVLHALAEPEYMESWMQIPGSDRVECGNRDCGLIMSRDAYDKAVAGTVAALGQGGAEAHAGAA